MQAGFDKRSDQVGQGPVQGDAAAQNTLSASVGQSVTGDRSRVLSVTLIDAPTECTTAVTQAAYSQFHLFPFVLLSHVSLKDHINLSYQLDLANLIAALYKKVAQSKYKQMVREVKSSREEANKRNERCSKLYEKAKDYFHRELERIERKRSEKASP